MSYFGQTNKKPKRLFLRRNNLISEILLDMHLGRRPNKGGKTKFGDNHSCLAIQNSSKINSLGNTDFLYQEDKCEWDMVPYKSFRGEWVFTRTDQAWGLPGYMWATLIAARSPDSSVCRDKVLPTPTRQAISTDSDSFRPRPEAISAHRAIVSALALLVCCKFSKWTEKRARARRSLADSGQVWTARHSRSLKTKDKHLISFWQGSTSRDPRSPWS